MKNRPDAGKMTAAEIRSLAYEELVSEALSEMLTDGNVVNALAKIKQQDKGLWQTIKEAVADLLRRWGEVLGVYKGRAAATPEAQALRSMEKTFKKLQKMYTEAFAEANEVEGAVEGTIKISTDNSGQKLKSRNSNEKIIYDYTKSFSEQVDDYKKGLFPQNDTLLVGATPKTWQKVGFNALPVTINQTHVDYALNGNKDFDHHIGESLLKELPNAIQSPVAIIQSQSPGNSNRAVVIFKMSHNGKQVIAAVEVDGVGRTNNVIIDCNAITSIFGKSNAIKQLKNAIENTVNSKSELFYWNKKEAQTLLQKAGLQLPSVLPRDGFVNSIRSLSSNVKVKFNSYTETQQFKRWFGDWQNHPKKASKVVNKDGTPRIVYHYTNTNFTNFDTSKSGSNEGQTHGDGIYLCTNPYDFSYAGKIKMDMYANIRNPFKMQLTNRQATYVLEKYAIKNHDLDNYNGLYRNHAMQKLTSPVRVFDYLSEYAADNGIKVSDILKDLGFDGVNEGSIWVAFNSDQLKSATENIGTYNGTYSNIFYQDRGTESNRSLLANKQV